MKDEKQRGNGASRGAGAGRRCRGFSLVELLVVVAIVVILGSIFVPYLAKVQEADRRARCADNLRRIMQGLRDYAKVNKDAYPCTTYDPARRLDGYVAYTGADSANPFSRDTHVQPSDVTASLWLLVRGGLVPARTFICPSSSDQTDPMEAADRPMKPDQRSNFTSGHNLSYSYACPFSSAASYKLNDTLPADFALMADKNPGTDNGKNNVAGPSFDSPPFELAQANSNNHQKAGQNVLYADGHVAFQSTPYCGVGSEARRDNIYTALTPVPLTPGNRPPAYTPGFFGRNTGPAWMNDSYLVPSQND